MGQRERRPTALERTRRLGARTSALVRRIVPRTIGRPEPPDVGVPGVVSVGGGVTFAPGVPVAPSTSPLGWPEP